MFRGLQVDGDELTYASFAHGNAKKTVHFCHGQAVVRHYEKTGLEAFVISSKRLQKRSTLASSTSSVDLIQHTYRRRIGQEHGEEERQCRHKPARRPTTAAHNLQFFAGRARHDLQAGFQRIFRVRKRQNALVRHRINVQKALRSADLPVERGEQAARVLPD